MALTTEQQTSHLSRLQQEILAWDYYRMGGEDDPGAAAGRTLREVPKTFASINEYLDVFEPLVLEECAAQVCRGEEGDARPSNVAAVLSSERVDGFHVVKFVLGEEAMREFRDNDLILAAKTDPAPDKDETKTNKDRDRDKVKDEAEDEDEDAVEERNAERGIKKKHEKGDAKGDGDGDDERASAYENMYALGFVDGRDSRNVMRVRFHLPEAGGGQGVFKRRAALTDDDFTRFRSVRNALATPKKAWYLMHLANMSTIAREWLALHAFPALPFAHTILGGKPAAKAAHSSWELPEPLSKAIESAYNDSQLTALKAALEKQPITLIQGPPGTGKTRIILSLLSVILHAVPGVKSGQEIDLKRFLETRDERKPLSPAENASVHRRAAPWMCGVPNPRDAPPPPRDAPPVPPPPPEKPEVVGETESRRTKVLVCAPSNSALDEIVLRIMQSGLLGPNGSPYSPTLVRVGVNVHHSVESVSMEALVRERVGEVGDKVAGLAAASSEKKFERALEKDRVKLAILDEAAVVCSTLSFSGSGMFARMTRQFDVVVIDEAAQAVEPSTLVPLCYGAKQVFLVGDPRQLPATVLSSIATDHNYDQSLFKRFEQCGYPIHLLKTQYRMHPAIREFPSSRFYAGELEDGPKMAAKTKRPWHDNMLFRPFVFIDVAGKEYQGGGMSWANDDEATLAVALVATLVKNYAELASGEKIGVISPYKAQVKNIRRRLAEALGEERARKVDVNSIDGFQGREKDVCIFSVVRAPTKGRGLGFVADERRINVGLTRSKSSLIVLGSAKALKGDDNWGGLVASARDRNLIVNLPRGSKDYKAFVAKHGATYDADDLSGDEQDEPEEAVETDEEDGYGAATGVEHGGDPLGGGREGGVKGHVHRPDWVVSSHLAIEAAEALRRNAGSPALPGVGADGFAAKGVEDELVSEAPGKVGDDYGGNNGGDDDGDEDPYAPEPETQTRSATRAKRTRASTTTATEKKGTAGEKKTPEKKGTAAAAKGDATSPPAAKRTRSSR